MKNYYLILSGLALGFGITLLADSKKEQKNNNVQAKEDKQKGIFYIGAGAALAFVAIKYIDKK